MPPRTRVNLPEAVKTPVEVYVNGVLRERGRDYEVEGRSLVFRSELRQEGRLGFWRWTSIFFGVAGTYRQNDSIDVVYRAAGRRVVATHLRIAGYDDAAEPVG